MNSRKAWRTLLWEVGRFSNEVRDLVAIPVWVRSIKILNIDCGIVISFISGNPCLVDAEIISNGKFDKPTGSFVASGSDLTIKCNKGFVLKGVAKVTCKDGKLSVGENTGCRVSLQVVELEKKIQFFIMLLAFQGLKFVYKLQTII